MIIRSVVTVAVLFMLSMPPALAVAAPVSTMPGGVCDKLAGEYDQAEKALAMTFAEGVGDDSAVRETSRQIESSNFISMAGIAVSLMEAHHCSMPDHAPSTARYLSPALTCATDRLKNGSPDTPSCKMDTWQPTN